MKKNLKHSFIFFTKVICTLLLIQSNNIHAQTLDVSVILHEARSTTNADGGGDDDIYWQVEFTPLIGDGDISTCSSKSVHVDGAPHIFPEWTCSFPINGADPLVQIDIQLWEHDGTLFTGGDDHFDVRPGDGKDISIVFNPVTNEVRIVDIPGLDDFQCSSGKFRLAGDSGEDRAEIVFSVSASIFGGNGDSDQDGLYDSWEQCGVDSDGDQIVDIDLPALGADPFRKDLFVEIDWFIDDDAGGTSDHSHEPWLPSLINAWSEFAIAPVTNPRRPDGTSSQGGIALHVDVGQLYTDYNLDVTGDGIPEYTVPASGNLDLSLDLNRDGIPDDWNTDGIPDVMADGFPDIGNLGGGNRICNDLTGLPCRAIGEGSVPLTQADATTVRRNNFDTGRTGIFRYCVFAHSVNARTPTCDGTSGVAPWGEVDFVVSLPSFFSPPCGGTGAWPRELPFLASQSPSGLPIDGTRGQHTGTFLHELGHSLGLGHGGGDGINRKPNYLSVMSYNYQIPGVQFDFTIPVDGIADPLPCMDRMGNLLPCDFDADGMPDGMRYSYSQNILPLGSGALVENNLDETIGVNGITPPAIVFYGPFRDTDGDGIFDIGVNQALSTGSIDWSRGDDDGDGNPATDNPVNGLTPNPPLIPAGIPTDINRDGIFPQTLQGFNDYRSIGSGDLTPPRSGLSWEDVVRFRRMIQRIKQIPDESYIEQHCDSLIRITFEEFPPGTIIDNEYGPSVSFLRDADRTPTITGPEDRRIPTQSPAQSLDNRKPEGSNQHDPLIISFDPPQKFVGLYAGHGKEPFEFFDEKVSIKAFDQEGISLGTVSGSLPDYLDGITGFIGIGAIFNDQLISKIELTYEVGFGEPVHIDELIFCRQQRSPSPETVPEQVPQPQFGETPITITIDALALTESGSEDGDPGHTHIEESPINVPVVVNGDTRVASFFLETHEGETLQLSAPETFSSSGVQFEFLHWRQNETIFFANGHNEISRRFLADGTLTAVYIKTPTPQDYYEYPVKIVCGKQNQSGNLRLARGVYSTTINIYNPNETDVRFFKKLALSYPPGGQIAGEVMPIGFDVLKPGEALATDCIDIEKRLFPNGCPTPYLEGFVVLQSPMSLDVSSVYTTAKPRGFLSSEKIVSIDVEQIHERKKTKRVE